MADLSLQLSRIIVHFKEIQHNGQLLCFQLEAWNHFPPLVFVLKNAFFLIIMYKFKNLGEKL